MSTGPAKVFIKVESSSEQQETLKNLRKQLKPLQQVQPTATIDKENLTGRQIIGKNLVKPKIETEITNTTIDKIKRVKYETKSTQTEDKNPSKNEQKKQITENDLTETNPSEYYWELLAEKRRQALDDTLEENKKLHERIESLEEELETSRKMVEEANHLVEVLTEMLQENEKESIENDDDNDNEETPNIDKKEKND